MTESKEGIVPVPGTRGYQVQSIEKHEFEPEQDNPDRCAVCGNSRDWHPRDWR